MRTHEQDARCWLAELSDFRQQPLPGPVAANLDALAVTLAWAKDYLCNPHEGIGRRGPVCPFTVPSLRRELFFLTVCPGADLAQDEVVDLVRAYRDWFLEMEPREAKQAQYKSINIVFPDLPERAWTELIEATQERLKPEYVPHGIMIGEFHPGPPDKEALWNPDFRPLRSPLPLLSIRHMVPTDFAFLRGRRDFMESYLRIHGRNLPVQMADDVHRVAAAFGLRVPGQDEPVVVPAAPPAAPAELLVPGA